MKLDKRPANLAHKVILAQAKQQPLQPAQNAHLGCFPMKRAKVNVNIVQKASLPMAMLQSPVQIVLLGTKHLDLQVQMQW